MYKANQGKSGKYLSKCVLFSPRTQCAYSDLHAIGLSGGIMGDIRLFGSKKYMLGNTPYFYTIKDLRGWRSKPLLDWLFEPVAMRVCRCDCDVSGC